MKVQAPTASAPASRPGRSCAGPTARTSASAVSKGNPDKVIPKMWLYLAVLLVTTFVIAFVPWFSIGFL